MTIHGLTIDTSAATPVYRQIAEGIQVALRDGRLTAGQQLPPTRDLAKQLSVNRNTVIAAYDLLVELGAATGHTGRGTFLAGPKTTRVGDPWLGAFARAVEETLRERGAEVLSYGPTAGYGPLRETIATEMTHKGTPCDASSILVTNGSQQALELARRPEWTV